METSKSGIGYMSPCGVDQSQVCILYGASEVSVSGDFNLAHGGSPKHLLYHSLFTHRTVCTETKRSSSGVCLRNSILDSSDSWSKDDRKWSRKRPYCD